VVGTRGTFAERNAPSLGGAVVNNKIAMAEISQNILIQYFVWHFYDQSKAILKAWKNFLLFNLNYFSVPILIKTFFYHWRQYKWYYPRGFDIPVYLEVFFSNLISRVLGAIMRSFLIVIGLFLEIFIFFGGAILFFGWLILPALLILGLIFSLK